MIARYKNKLFNIDQSIDPVNIWSYFPIEGFSKGITRRGTIYFEKYVPKSEIDEIFDVDFYVYWNNEKWWISTVNKAHTKLWITGTEKEVSEKYGLEVCEIDRGIPLLWTKEIAISECNNFILKKKNHINNSVNETYICEKEFLRLYKLFIEDFNPYFNCEL